uniref:(northern house mosquito) hypothetical protein n=1 Tax=Culex pipiens TaxID=7175 RepID=A0A8D8FWX2_CULPI
MPKVVGSIFDISTLFLFGQIFDAEGKKGDFSSIRRTLVDRRIPFDDDKKKSFLKNQRRFANVLLCNYHNFCCNNFSPSLTLNTSVMCDCFDLVNIQTFRFAFSVQCSVMCIVIEVCF